MGLADRDHAGLSRRPADGLPGTPSVWISFGDSWYHGADPLPWSAHATLWGKLAEYADHTRYRLGLGGVPVEMVRRRTEV